MLKARAVTARLQKLPITALKGSAGQGARLSQLQTAGYRTVGDLLTALRSAEHVARSLDQPLRMFVNRHSVAPDCRTG